eukprot:1806149-Pyramimonas_sp.AAC.1
MFPPCRSTALLIVAMLSFSAGSPIDADGGDVHVMGFLWASSTAVGLNELLCDDIMDTPNIVLQLAIQRITDELPRIPRTTALFEVFAGKASIARAMRSKGFSSHYLERDKHSWHDACTLVGMLYCLWMVASVVDSGLVWFSPQCSTWGQMCNHHTLRSTNNPLGHLSNRVDVREANFISQLL